MLDWTRLTPAVKRAAGIAKSSFPAHHEAADVEQELWVWIMENKNTITRVLTEDGGENKLDALLLRAANTYLKGEDAATYGYTEEDRFYYSLDLIKSILEVVFKHEDWQSFADAIGDGMPRAKTDPSQGGNNLASYADVSSAVDKLPDDYYNLLVWRYKYQKTFTAIGEMTDQTKQSVSERHQRALKAIQVLLGQQPLSELRRGYDGRTEARGNASGNARIERDYQG